MQGAEHGAGATARDDAEPRRSRLIVDRIAEHGAEHERAFKAEIDAARFLREALAERHEHERRRDADRAADHGENDGEERPGHSATPLRTTSTLPSPLAGEGGSRGRREPDEGSVRASEISATPHPPLRGTFSRKGRRGAPSIDRIEAHVPASPAAHLEDREPAVERLGCKQDDEDDALEHQHGRVRQAHPPLHDAAGRPEPAEQNRDGNDRDRIMSGQERDQDAGEAVARRKRRVGPPLDAGDLEVAGEAGAGAGDHRARQDEAADRQALRLRGPHVAAGDLGRETERRPLHQDAQRDRQHDARSARPQCTAMPGILGTAVGGADRQGRGLHRLVEIAQRPFDEEVHDRDGDIGQQQRRDRLVDAPLVAEPAGEADPEAAGRDRRTGSSPASRSMP